MFTGLIEGTGSVRNIIRVGPDLRLSVQPRFDMADCQIGDSVAVNGVCLTITDIKGSTISMDVSLETISRSTINGLKQGDKVNLERALALSDRLGGHLVSGHVDGIGRIGKKEQVGSSWLFRIGIDENISRYIIEKGAIAVDGISLTINHCRDSFFEVNIIPETARETTLFSKNVGDSVNIETDLVAKYIEKFLINNRKSGKNNASSSINPEMLNQYGFGD